MKTRTSLLILLSLFLGGLAWGLLPGDLMSGLGRTTAVTQQSPEETREQIQTELGTFAKLAKELKPSVVNISVIKPMRQDQYFNPDSAEIFTPEASGQGSGVIISSDGAILTNNHVVEDANTIRVKLSDGRELGAQVVGSDSSTDLALIQLEDATDLPVARLGDSDRLSVGDWVMAIGNPFGLEATVTVGVLSGKGRTIGASDYDDFLQTDASINPGNSGGPLFNTKGEVIGINTAIVPGGQGIGFSIPINLAKEVSSQLRSDGRVVRGFIGVGIQPLSAALRSALSIDDTVNGALVSSLMPNGPGSRAGLKIGDVITEVGGTPVATNRELLNAVARLKVGRGASFKLVRGKKSESVTIAILERPAPEQDKPASHPAESGPTGGLGVVIRDLESGSGGVRVDRVLPGSAAFRAGIREGDVIRSVGSKDVKASSDFVTQLGQSKGPVALLVDRHGRTVYLVVDKIRKTTPAE